MFRTYLSSYNTDRLVREASQGWLFINNDNVADELIKRLPLMSVDLLVSLVEGLTDNIARLRKLIEAVNLDHFVQFATLLGQAQRQLTIVLDDVHESALELNKPVNVEKAETMDALIEYLGMEQAEIRLLTIMSPEVLRENMLNWERWMLRQA